MKPLRVLFSGLDHRVRRRETIDHPPKGVVFKTLQPIAKMKADHRLTYVPGKIGVTKNLEQLSRVWKYNNFLPRKALAGVDLVYSPGYILFTNTPYVVEVDNVAVFAYYKLPLLRLCKPIIKQALRAPQCKAIICISEAAKKSVSAYFNDEQITRKCIVVYPYAGPALPAKKPGKTVTFLFIAANPYLKGGQEVIHSFCELVKRYPQARLTVVAKKENIKSKLWNTIQNCKQIHFQQANLDKKTLYRDYYMKSDVFVQPSYRDSFGMVYLEALRAGLPIISTDMFAAPEISVNGRNAIILQTPIPSFTKNFLPNSTWWEADVPTYVQKHPLKNFERKLYSAMKFLVDNPKLRAKMSKESHAILKERFSEKVRLAALSRALRAERK